jgi:hypothetical protein
VTDLPAIAPHVLADVLDDLPPRLRRRLDAAVGGAAGWSIESTADGATATLDADTVVTWRLHDGVLTAAADLTCGCLLAPKCLHRAVAVAAAPVTAETAAPAAAEAPVPVETTAASPAEVAAARALLTAAGRVLDVGATGAGAATRAELLRAVHAGRIAGLHRPSAAGLRVAAALVDGGVSRDVLAADLTGLLLACHDLVEGIGDPVPLRGTARREYRPVGAKRLYGLCSETVLTSAGYAGVVTHVMDTGGELWTVPAVTPGGPELIKAAAYGPVSVGESGLTHHELARAGLLLSTGTASADRRLGSGAAVRAVAAAGTAWTEDPPAALWRVPLADQLDRAFGAADLPDGLRPAGAGLLFLSGRVLGRADPGLRLRIEGDVEVRLVGVGPVASDNLALLAELVGTDLLAVAKVRTDATATATAVAVTPDPAATRLPSAWAGRVDVGVDRLQRSHLVTSGGARPPVPVPSRDSAVEPPSQLLAHWVHRVVLGGRSMAAVASAEDDLRALHRIGMTGTAAVLADLAATARSRHRDTFGRLIDPDNEAFSRAWLRAGLYLRAFRRHTARLSWLPAAS